MIVARSPIWYGHMCNFSRGHITNFPSACSLCWCQDSLLKKFTNLNYRLNRLKIYLLKNFFFFYSLQRNSFSCLKLYLHILCCLLAFYHLICILFPFNAAIKEWYTYCGSIYNLSSCINRNDPPKCKGDSSGSFSFLARFLKSPLSFVVINKASFLSFCEVWGSYQSLL